MKNHGSKFDKIKKLSRVSCFFYLVGFEFVALSPIMVDKLQFIGERGRGGMRKGSALDPQKNFLKKPT